MISDAKVAISSRVNVAPGGCWLWTRSVNDFGYGRIRLGNIEHRAHRLAWSAFIGPIPTGLCVLHCCDNPPCCNPAHLFLGTRADNMRDMIRKGRRKKGIPVRGEAVATSSLTENAVREIRRLRRDGEWTHAELARRFGVAKGTIGFVVRGETWRHVSDV